MGSPRKLSRNGRMSGMPPHTAASNNKSIPASSAAANSSAPCWARSALFAVTTGLPFFSAARISLRGSSTPPINSTTKSTVGSLTTNSASVVMTSAATEPECAAVFRTATRATSRRTPLRAAMVSDCCFTKRTNAAPTVPCPITPRRTRCSVIPFTLLAIRSHPIGLSPRMFRVAQQVVHCHYVQIPLVDASPCCSWNPLSAHMHQ